MSGFRIVSKGNTIHDETDEGVFSKIPERPTDLNELCKDRFACSTLMIGPHAHQISIPTFADVEEEGRA